VSGQLALFDLEIGPRRLTRAEAGVSKETRPGAERLLADLVARGLDRDHLRVAAALVLELDAEREPQ
jgi:hypothetical protein